MRKLISFLVICSLAIVGFSQEINWKVDPSHTEIQFIADYMVFTEVTGEFQKYDMSFTSQGDDFSTAKIRFSVETASINTNEGQRDGHLKSPDFFDVEKYPKMIFVGKSMKKLSGNKYELTGDLTIKDITKEIKLEVTHKGTDKDPYGNIKAGFRLKGAINRYDWGLKWNAVLETGSLLVSEVIELICNVTLIKGT